MSILACLSGSEEMRMKMEWKLRFLRYVDTKHNKKQLRKCILESPYILSQLTVPTTKTQDAKEELVIEETYENTSLENRALINAESEAIPMILNGIGDNIYSTVDACSSVKEMWNEYKA
ncbi:hypothetical protein Tco_0512103 [Tanacetum coccineum]